MAKRAYRYGACCRYDGPDREGGKRLIIEKPRIEIWWPYWKANNESPMYGETALLCICKIRVAILLFISTKHDMEWKEWEKGNKARNLLHYSNFSTLWIYSIIHGNVK